MPRLLASAVSRFRQRLVQDGSYGVGLNLFFQDFDRAVSDALEYAKSHRQGDRGRGGPELVVEREVSCSWVYYLV